MESNKYNIENFEKFLREKTDEFRMYPSKRVWYSIYNNMHPGNRLPSVSMSIILTGFLFLVGYLNTNTVNKETAADNALLSKTAVEKIHFASNVQQPVDNNSLSTASVNSNTRVALLPSTQLNKRQHVASNTRHSQNRGTGSNKSAVQTIVITAGSVEDEADQNKNSNEWIETTNNNNENIVASAVVITTTTTAQINNNPTTDYNNLAATNNNTVANEESLIVEIESTVPQASTTLNIAADNAKATEAPVASVPGNNENITATPVATNNAAPLKSNKPAGLTLADKAWMEDFAMHNKPAKKWGGKLSLQTYVTPSVVYRNLKNNAADKPLSGNTNNNNNRSIDNAVTHKPSFGVETGVSLQYSFAKRLKLKAGLQLNYTRYNAHAFETNHPIATSITMNNEADNYVYETFKTSNYSNATGLSPAKLHNETYQLSIPIGADFKLASVDNFSWYAGAAIQPTILVYAKSFIISADRRSYVHDPSLLNRFNLNAGFETYISYKTASGYTWQLGPQYRTQIFSTNTKLYSMEERLINFGFKVGVTKQL
ncbi:MAG: outer membrane beta-barrel protein [Bacteroidota bacterium]